MQPLPREASNHSAFPVTALERLYRQSLLLVGLFDETDRLRYANPAFRKVFQLDEAQMPTWTELIRANYAAQTGTLIDTDDFERWLSSTLSRRAKLPYRAFEAPLHDGRWMLMTETVDAEGWMLCCATDVTDLSTGARQLREQRDLATRAALTDPLTGLSNRRHILDVLAQRLAAPHPAGCCIAILDLDHFKRINDRFGHPCGDLVLADFARRLQQALRRADACGRLGGEEFMVILDGAHIGEANEVIARVLNALRTDTQGVPGQPALRYTCSAGLTALSPGDSVASAYSRADDALYRAKATGRDRCVAG